MRSPGDCRAKLYQKNELDSIVQNGRQFPACRKGGETAGNYAHGICPDLTLASGTVAGARAVAPPAASGERKKLPLGFFTISVAAFVLISPNKLKIPCHLQEHPTHTSSN